MTAARTHFFSLLSIFLALVELLISFGSTSHFYWGWPFAEHSTTFRTIVIVLLVNGWAAIILGIVAMAKERSKILSAAALFLAFMGFLLSVGHLAV